MLVDDDRRIRDLLSRFLCGEGYRVTTAMSASDARAKLLGLHFDLLILDVMMPGETGFDLARFIRTSSVGADHHADGAPRGRKPASRACRSAPTTMSPSRSSRASWCLRIGNILKRTAPPPVETLEQVAFGPYVYHLDRGELRQGEEIVHLTDREREMLRILACAPGRDRAAQRARPATAPSTSARSTCRSTVCGARSKKIRPIRLFLQAVRGIGYRLVASP